MAATGPNKNGHQPVVCVHVAYLLHLFHDGVDQTGFGRGFLAEIRLYKRGQRLRPLN